MGKTIKFPLIGSSKKEESNAWNMQETYNWFEATTSDGRSQNALVPTPGTDILTNTGSSTINGPFISVGGFGICAPLVTYDGANTTYELATISSIPGTPVTNYSAATSFYVTDTPQNCSITADAQNIYMVVGGGSATSTANSNLFVLQNVTTTPTANLVSFSNTLKPDDIEYLDGWLVMNHLGLPRGLFSVAIANGIGTTGFNTKFDYMSQPGDYVKRIKGNNGYLYLFGDTHYEIWYNTGNQDFPFEPIKEATQAIGLAGRDLITTYLDSIYFVGITDSFQYGVYQLKGLELTRISTPDIDSILNRDTRAFGYKTNGMYIEEYYGHVFVHVVYSDAVPYQLVYDITTGKWHQEGHLTASGSTYGLYVDGIGYAANKMVLAPFYTSQSTYGLYQTNKYASRSTVWESSSLTRGQFDRYRISPHISGEDGYLYHNRVRIDYQAPTIITNDANLYFANIELFSSDNDGKTWNSHGNKNINQRAYGNISGDKRLEWFRLGRSDDRIYKIVTNSTIPITITGAWLEAEPGYR